MGHARLCVLGATAFLLLSCATPAQAGKVVDTSGHRVGWASWAKVLDRAGHMEGYLVRAGHAEYCLQKTDGKLIAAIESRTVPVRLWVNIYHRTRRNWQGKAVQVGDDWALYQKVDGRWVRKGTASGGRGASAVAALRLLLWR